MANKPLAPADATKVDTSKVQTKPNSQAKMPMKKPMRKPKMTDYREMMNNTPIVER